MTALYTKAELNKKSVAEVRELAESHDLEFEFNPVAKAVAIAALLEIEAPDDDIEEELDDEAELEPEDVLAEEADEDNELDDEELPDEDEEPELPAEEDDIEEAPKATKARAKKPAADKPAANADSLAAKQVAHILGTEAKTLRQFLRSDASTFEAVGSGGRYEFTKGDVPKIKAEFDAWKAGHAARGSKRGAAAAATEAEPVEEVEEIEGIEELEDEEAPVADDDEIELEDEE